MKADAGQIEQVIMNLAINARDAMPRGGKISIRTANVDVGADHERVRLGMQPGRYVMLQVTDTGHGIDPEALEHLFEPFFTTKDKGKGTGLGLATVYGIVKQGRGRHLGAERAGQGHDVHHLSAARGGRGRAGRAGGRRTRRRPGTETILLVEDEDGVRRLLKHVLSKNGYNVIEAASGPEALALTSNCAGPIDLLLTDIVMPRMSGRELADRMVRAAARPEDHLTCPATRTKRWRGRQPGRAVPAKAAASRRAGGARARSAGWREGRVRSLRL